MTTTTTTCFCSHAEATCSFFCLAHEGDGCVALLAATLLEEALWSCFRLMQNTTYIAFSSLLHAHGATNLAAPAPSFLLRCQLLVQSTVQAPAILLCLHKELDGPCHDACQHHAWGRR